ncbi:PEP-utilizing enzyme [Mycobacterium sp. NPDC051198]
MHEPIADGVRWTTRNVGEAIPGVPTPLTWSLWSDAINDGSRKLYRCLGLYSTTELAAQESRGSDTISISHGHPVAIIDVFSVAMSRVPGMSPSKFEHDYFGIDSDEATPRPQPRGWPRVLLTAPATLIRHRREVDSFISNSRSWWESFGDREMTAAEARAAIPDALSRFRHAMFLQALQAALTQSSYGVVALLVSKAGQRGLETQLLCATADMEEAKVADGLWEIGRGHLSVSEFVTRHGYHGPDEGELASRSWREAPELVANAAAAYRNMSDAASPASRRRSRLSEQRAAITLVRRGLNPAVRPVLHAALQAASRGEERREAVKAAFLQVLDVLRRAVRCTAADFAARGLLNSADDIAYLTFDEIASGRPPARTEEIVEFRRQRREQYKATELHGAGVGDPVPLSHTTSLAQAGDTVAGLPVSAGAATGFARVVIDAADCLQPLSSDEILVARTTDPGWVALFMTAAGLVVDVGGPLSHAAIIARSLGIPCVINTIDGTKRIPVGAQISVDGSTGRVSILTAGESPQAPESATSAEVAPACAEYSAEMVQVLHVPLVKGMASAKVISSATGLTLSVVRDVLSRAKADGLAKSRKGRLAGWILTPAGRQTHAVLLAKHIAALGCRADVEEAYKAFLALNQPFKEICTAWQLRPDGDGAPQINDHSDSAYDAAVIGRLSVFNEEALAMTAMFPSALPHLSRYAPRLEHAWRRVSDGEHSAFAAPLDGSYHDVWMELHQDLMATLGRERSSADGH